MDNMMDNQASSVFVPTEEQKNILSCERNCAIAAGPGSGKTTVLSRKITAVLEKTRSYRGVAAISYTNKASYELEKRVKELSKDTKSSFFGTMDSFYISNFIIPFGNRFFGYSTEHLVFTGNLANLVTCAEYQRAYNSVISLIRRHEEIPMTQIIQQNLNPILHLPESVFDYIKGKYQEGKLPLGLVPGLATLIFMSSTSCQKYILSRYCYLMIDEFQDAGYEQYQLFKRISEIGVISWAVGDVNQFLFRFADKDVAYLIALLNDIEFENYPLTQNRRCHPSINQHAQSLFFQTEEEIDVEENRVYHHFVEGNEVNIGEWFNTQIDRIKERFEIQDNSQIGVLATKDNTLRLFASELILDYKFYHKILLDTDQSTTGKLLYNLLSMSFDSKENVHTFFDKYLQGSLLRDKQVIRQLKTTVREFCSLVVQHYETENENKEQIKSSFENIVEHIYPINDSLQHTFDCFKELLDEPKKFSIFIKANKEEVQLMTIHKSKGLEFDFVIHLDLYQWILPSYKWLKYDDMDDYRDSLSLHYVALTRARKGVILVTSSKRHNNSLNIIDAHVSEFITYRTLESWNN